MAQLEQMQAPVTFTLSSAHDVDGPAAGGYQKPATPLVSRKALPSLPASAIDCAELGSPSEDGDALPGRAVSSTSPVRFQAPPGVEIAADFRQLSAVSPAGDMDLAQVEAELRELEARLGVKIPDSPAASAQNSPCARTPAADIAASSSAEVAEPSLVDAPEAMSKYRTQSQRPPPLTTPPSSVGDSDCGSSCGSGTNTSQPVTQTRHAATLAGVDENIPMLPLSDEGLALDIGAEAEFDEADLIPSPVRLTGGAADLLAQIEADMKRLEAEGVLRKTTEPALDNASADAAVTQSEELAEDSVGQAFTSIFGNRASSFGAAHALEIAEAPEENACSEADVSPRGSLDENQPHQIGLDTADVSQQQEGRDVDLSASASVLNSFSVDPSKYMGGVLASEELKTQPCIVEVPKTQPCIVELSTPNESGAGPLSIDADFAGEAAGVDTFRDATEVAMGCGSPSGSKDTSTTVDPVSPGDVASPDEAAVGYTSPLATRDASIALDPVSPKAFTSQHLCGSDDGVPDVMSPSHSLPDNMLQCEAVHAAYDGGLDSPLVQNIDEPVSDPTPATSLKAPSDLEAEVEPQNLLFQDEVSFIAEEQEFATAPQDLADDTMDDDEGDQTASFQADTLDFVEDANAEDIAFRAMRHQYSADPIDNEGDQTASFQADTLDLAEDANAEDIAFRACASVAPRAAVERKETDLSSMRYTSSTNTDLALLEDDTTFVVEPSVEFPEASLATPTAMPHFEPSAGGRKPEADEEKQAGLPGDAEMNEAATKLQSVHRGRKAREEVAQKRSDNCKHVEVGLPDDAEMNEAAVKLQSMHRGRKAREEVAERISVRSAREEVAAIKLEDSKHAAATKLQSMHRGRKTRQEVAEMNFEGSRRALPSPGVGGELQQFFNSEELGCAFPLKAPDVARESCEDAPPFVNAEDPAYPPVPSALHALNAASCDGKEPQASNRCAPSDEFAELEAELRELENKLPGYDAEEPAIILNASQTERDVIDVLQGATVASPTFPQDRGDSSSPSKAGGPEHWSAILGREAEEKRQRQRKEAEERLQALDRGDRSSPSKAGDSEHWSVILARQRKEAGIGESAEAEQAEEKPLPVAEAKFVQKGLFGAMDLSGATLHALDARCSSTMVDMHAPTGPRQEQADSFLNQVFPCRTPEHESPWSPHHQAAEVAETKGNADMPTPGRKVEKASNVSPVQKTSSVSPPRQRKQKKRPPALQGPLFSEAESPAKASSRVPAEKINAPSASTPGPGTESSLNRQAAAPATDALNLQAAEQELQQNLELAERVLVEPDRVLMGQGLYGNISLQTQEEQRIKKQKELEKLDRQARKRREDGLKKQQRMDRLGMGGRAPPLAAMERLRRPAPLPVQPPRQNFSSDSGHGGGAELPPIRESLLPRISEPSSRLPRSASALPPMSRKPAERVFQGVPMPSGVPVRHVPPAPRLPPMGAAANRLAPSASEPVLSPSGRSQLAGPTADSIEKQKMRLASKMEVFQAAQQQLNNVGNLSADELRGLLQRLHMQNDPLANGSASVQNEGEARVVKRRMRQVDKFCKGLF